jgi:hypothetical protein
MENAVCTPPLLHLPGVQRRHSARRPAVICSLRDPADRYGTHTTGRERVRGDAPGVSVSPVLADMFRRPHSSRREPQHHSARGRPPTPLTGWHSNPDIVVPLKPQATRGWFAASRTTAATTLAILLRKRRDTKTACTAPSDSAVR